MISVNLLPKEERSEELRLGRPRARFLAWLGASVALIVLIGGSLLMQEMRIQSLRDDLLIAEQEGIHLQGQADAVRRLDLRKQQLESRLSLVFDLSRGRKLNLELMDEIALRVPDYLWLTSVKPAGPEARLIEGLTFSNLIVADLMTRLEQGDAFESVKLGFTERTLIGEEPVVKFSLTTHLGQ